VRCESAVVDLTEITAVRDGLVTRLRHRVHQRAAPVERRALVVLVVAAFLLGAVLSGLTFAGIWRHTASEGAQARAEQATALKTLKQTRGRLTAITHELAVAKARVATTAAQRRRLAGELARLRRTSERLQATLPRLHSITSDAATLGAKTQKLQAALGALANYIRTTSSTGADPGFIAAQLQYLAGATASTQSLTAALARESAAIEAVAASARRP
jgi:septal ring factor EnvC (AmiA/AmiB activator)